MNFLSLIIFICIFNPLNVSFAQESNDYKSISYSQGLEIFSNAYGLQLNPDDENLSGSISMKNCSVKYNFKKLEHRLLVEVQKLNQNYTYQFWSYFESGVPYRGFGGSTPSLPIQESGKVIGFTALRKVGTDCETQGCAYEETIQLVVKPKVLLIQDVGPAPSPYINASIETVICNQN